jgi:hypothetical protein
LRVCSAGASSAGSRDRFEDGCLYTWLFRLIFGGDGFGDQFFDFMFFRRFIFVGGVFGDGDIEFRLLSTFFFVGDVLGER